MSKMMVVVFDDEKQAYEGSKALAELHREGNISVYGGAVIGRDAEGRVEVKDDASEGPVGTAVGMLTGALIGMFAGPAGLAVGAASGGMMGSFADLMNLGVGVDYLDEVGAKLEPGKFAVVAEVEENWVTPVDSRMEALGGEVFRRYRADVENDQLDRDIAATREEWNDLKEEISTANEENKAKLHEKSEAAKAKMKDAGDRASAKLDALEKEHDQKVAALQAQLAESHAENKQKINDRIEKVKSNYVAAGSKMRASWEKAKQSLSS